jgi:hypothetical protein
MNDPNALNESAPAHDPNRIGPPAGGAAAGGPGPKKRRRRRRSRSEKQNANRTEQTSPVQAVPDAEPVASEGARALAESLRAAVLRHTSQAVLGRGTGYAKRNRVAELRVSAGRVRARVRGSGEQRYRVELAVPQRPAPPLVTKIRWSCDCPYAAEHRRGTCKHVVALALVAAKRIEKTESMYLRWLGQPAANAAEAAPAEFDALAERLMEAFTAQPVAVDDVLRHAVSVSPPPFDLPSLR